MQKKKQGVQGVQIFKKGSEFVFNYSTTLDARPCDLELLKNYRNLAINELEKLNFQLFRLEE